MKDTAHVIKYRAWSIPLELIPPRELGPERRFCTQVEGTYRGTKGLKWPVDPFEEETFKLEMEQMRKDDF